MLLKFTVNPHSDINTAVDFSVQFTTNKDSVHSFGHFRIMKRVIFCRELISRAYWKKSAFSMHQIVDRDNSVGISDSLRAGRSGD